MHKNLVLVLTFLQAYYITTAREQAWRLEFIRLLSSITGAATIHCFNQEDNFLTNDSSMCINSTKRVVMEMNIEIAIDSSC